MQRQRSGLKQTASLQMISFQPVASDEVLRNQLYWSPRTRLSSHLLSPKNLTDGKRHSTECSQGSVLAASKPTPKKYTEKKPRLTAGSHLCTRGTLFHGLNDFFWTVGGNGTTPPRPGRTKISAVQEEDGPFPTSDQFIPR